MLRWAIQRILLAIPILVYGYVVGWS